MNKIFFYTREEIVRKRNEKGEFIPLTNLVKIIDENGVESEIQEDIPNQFETETRQLKGCFNIDSVLVGVEVKEGFVVVLNDGHEETEMIQILKPSVIKSKKQPPYNANDIIEEKKRTWKQSEILLTGDNIKNFEDFMKN